MAVLFLFGLFFHSLDNIFAFFQKLQQVQLFGKIFDYVCDNLQVSFNGKNKQLSCNVDFFRLEFDTLLIEARLPKDKLKKTIKRVAKILEKKCQLLMNN